MPRKAKTEITTITKPAATKAKTKAVTEMPIHSQIVLDYNRFGNIGFSKVHESVDISFLTKKKFTGKITALFHFVRNTSVSHDLDSGKNAIFTIDEKPLLSLTQKAGNYDDSVFTVIKFIIVFCK